MHMDAALQAKHKLALVHTALQNAGIQHIHNIPYHNAPQSLHYRNRSDWAVAKTRSGKIIVGAFAPNSHDLVALSRCLVLRREISALLSTLGFQLNQTKMPVWPENNGLRYISAFANHQGQILLDFVFGGEPSATPFDSLCTKLLKSSAIKGISYSINNSPHNAIRTQCSQRVFGEETLPEPLGSISSQLSASNFTQLNSAVASQIYQTVTQWAGKCRVVWDLYCGSGAMGRNIDVQKFLYGAELSARSIEQAQLSAQNDPWDHLYEALDLQTQWPGAEKPNLILVNPPRKGLSALIIHQLRQNPVRLLYMSCNPESFAQNAKALYPMLQLTRLEAFDMLPHTLHTEVLGLFEPVL